MALTDEEAFARSDAVFVGDVSEYAPPPPGSTNSADAATWTFAVTEVYKGDVASTQEIVSEVSPATCGLEIPQHGQFLVFAQRDSHRDAGDGEYVGDGQYYAGLCGGTRSTEEGPLTIGENPYPPRGASAASTRGASDSQSDSEWSTENTAAIVAVVMVSLAAIGGLGALRQGRRHVRSVSP